MGMSVRRHGHALWRWLLVMDRPVAPKTDDELDAEMQQNLRWNFTFNVLDGAFFWLGLSFISTATILPLFVSKISPNPLLIGLLAMIGQSGWYLPQLFTAGWIEQLPRKKPVVANLGFFTERLPLFFLPLAALLAVSHPTWALIVFFTAFAAHGLGAGVVAPAWTDLIGRCFPVDLRGRYFGISSFIGTGLGAVGAIYSGRLLGAYPFPFNFALSFTLAIVFITLSWIFLELVREPTRPIPDEVVEQRGRSWRKIRNIVRTDENFRNYLLVRLLAAFGTMAAGFVTVAAIQRWAIADSQVGYFTAALLIGQTLGNLIAGVVADRHGHRLSLMISISITVTAYLLALVAPSPVWYNAVFLLMGVGAGMMIVSGVLINLEFSRPEHRPSYVGIANTTNGVGNMLAPLIGGLLAAVGYNFLFAAAAGFGILALLIMISVVNEPRRKTEFGPVSAD